MLPESPQESQQTCEFRGGGTTNTLHESLCLKPHYAARSDRDQSQSARRCHTASWNHCTRGCMLGPSHNFTPLAFPTAPPSTWPNKHPPHPMRCITEGTTSTFMAADVGPPHQGLPRCSLRNPASAWLRRHCLSTLHHTNMHATSPLPALRSWTKTLGTVNRLFGLLQRRPETRDCRMLQVTTHTTLAVLCPHLPACDRVCRLLWAPHLQSWLASKRAKKEHQLPINYERPSRLQCAAACFGRWCLPTTP